MALSTKVKTGLNSALRRFNLKIDTLTAERMENERLVSFENQAGLDNPIYPLLPGMADFDIGPVYRAFLEHELNLTRLKNPEQNDTGYTLGNQFFESPDADILYLMMRRFKPKTVIEIGCGNSTRVTRQAIIDGGLGTKIIAIDPQPRADIATLADCFVQSRVERVPVENFSRLEAGDILFIDSSHEVKVGNDVAHLLCRVFPILLPGVVIHVHDIFLPFEYPRRFFFGYPTYGEQYILHATVMGGGFEILWPGYYIQKVCPQAARKLPFLVGGQAQSFWIRKTR